MVIQHEAQHLENIAIVSGLLGLQKETAPAGAPSGRAALEDDRATVSVPGGRFVLGATRDLERAYDNERQAHEVDIDDFRIDRFPVTNRRYLAFVDAGGYREASLWSDEGRRWLETSRAEAPLGWERTDGAWRRRGLRVIAPLVPDEPVCGVSYFEAEAFARFEGRRLPTAAEWERAATFDPGGAKRMLAGATHRRPPPGEPRPRGGRPAPVGAHPSGAGAPGHDMQGNVRMDLEPLRALPGFRPFAYEATGPLLRRSHRVLRGLLATSPEVLRATFRNWYQPHVRQIFAGLRCATQG
jgi:iron(II)-dependent oxidoreductase